MGYVFDPDVLQECAKKGMGLPNEEAFDVVTAELAKVYPDYITSEPRSWIFNNAGGAMGQISLLHGSLSEYLLFFGSPIGTEGHSGRYRTEVWDFMISGECWCYIEGETERVVYKPGDCMYLGNSVAKGYRIPDFAWMLEYARGPIPSMVPFGLMDTLCSTLDLRTAGRTIGHYGKHVWRSLRNGKI